MKQLNIVHLYSKEMNIYGDNGNVLVLKKRLQWRGVPLKVSQIGIGQKIPTDTHLVIGGGGQDAGQSIIAEDLQKKAMSIKKLVDNDVPMFMVCGMYQMFGHFFKTSESNVIKGIAVLDISTVAGDDRIIGNIVCRTKWGDLVGYENHSGRTSLGANVKEFGVVKYGQGNNGTDNSEGAYQKNVFGTYMHGPVLAKSPHFTDHLLRCAMDVAGNYKELLPLENELENKAAIVAAKRPR